mmetsp:Transcript_8452/g.15301  ORF Transcript_8452/g.15301 Transcript_8452/m.15301 type:complete len:110 (-) Transcript_8452:1019-1348(-)
MMLFCPLCGNMLLVERGAGTGIRFHCQTCPYVHHVDKRLEKRVSRVQIKEVDDVMGGDSAWELADSTEIPCPSCAHSQAYFFQMQTRSADEPMTIFYRCKKCANQWKEN